MPRTLILHGWTNHRPPGHWHRRLAAALRDRGEMTLYPPLPDPDNPSLEQWLEVVGNELQMIREAGSGEVVVVAHSLGCMTWLHAALHGLADPPVDRVLLVAPAAPETLGAIAEFQLDLDDPRVRAASDAAARSLTIVGSDSDAWAPRGVQATFGDPLGVEATIIPGGAHITLADGWGPWQGVIDWVLDPSADLTRR